MGILDFFRSRPAADKPKARPGLDPPAGGGSGRGHTEGFLELEELNPDLRHPQSHRTYDQMYRGDADVKQVVNLVSNPITGGTWQVSPHGGEEANDEDRKVAEALKWALWDVMRPNLVGHLIEFLPVLFRSGFCPGEVVWGTAERDGEKLLVPRRIEMRLPRSVYRWHQKQGMLTGIEQYLPAGQDGNGGNVPASESYAQSGGGSTYRGTDSHELGTVLIPARNLVYYRVGAEGDNWEGVSLLRPAYKHWKLKDAIERIDAIGQEKDAVGTPVVYPPPGATPAQLTDIESMLGDLRANERGYVVMPGMKAGSGAVDGTGWLLELLSREGSSTLRDPMPSLQYHSNKIAAAFISEFMRLGHGQTGARATAQVQADPFLMGVEAIVGTVEQVLNDAIVLPFVAYNFPKAKDPPKLSMSLVDSTSLSQLADFVLKLTQVGALLPDRELEDFLRARADLPPINAEVAKQREADEDDMRRRVVGALNEPGADPFGSNADPGEHKDGKPVGDPLKRAGGKGQTGRPSGAPSGRGGAGKNPEPRGAAKNLDALGYGEQPERPSLHDDARWWELTVDLDGLEEVLDSTPQLFEVACSDELFALASEMSDEAATPLGRGAGPARERLQRKLLGELDDLYVFGADGVLAEVGAQCDAYGLTGRALQLDRGARDRGRAHLARRADVAADMIEAAMGHAMLGADLTHGQRGRAQILAEAEGKRALRRAAFDHGVAAVLHGRHDEGQRVLADESLPLVSARYSAKLDRGTCPECEQADDGTERALDDPVRLARQPPNPMCESTHSGFNRCRCIEVFTVNLPDERELTSLDSAVELHPYLQRLVNHLVLRGMDSARAMFVAVNVARQVATTGRVTWPGLQRAGAGDRSAAVDALAWWEAAQQQR